MGSWRTVEKDFKEDRKERGEAGKGLSHEALRLSRERMGCLRFTDKDLKTACLYEEKPRQGKARIYLAEPRESKRLS